MALHVSTPEPSELEFDCDGLPLQDTLQVQIQKLQMQMQELQMQMQIQNQFKTEIQQTLQFPCDGAGGWQLTQNESHPSLPMFPVAPVLVPQMPLMVSFDQPQNKPGKVQKPGKRQRQKQRLKREVGGSAMGTSMQNVLTASSSAAESMIGVNEEADGDPYIEDSLEGKAGFASDASFSPHLSMPGAPASTKVDVESGREKQVDGNVRHDADSPADICTEVVWPPNDGNGFPASAVTPPQFALTTTPPGLEVGPDGKREDMIQILRGCLAVETKDFNQALTETTVSRMQRDVVWGDTEDWKLLRPNLSRLLSSGACSLPENLMAVEAVRFRDDTFTPPDPNEEFCIVHGGAHNVYGAPGCHFMPLLSVAQWQALHGSEVAYAKFKWSDMVAAVTCRTDVTVDDSVRDEGDCFFDSIAVLLHVHKVNLQPDALAIVRKWLCHTFPDEMASMSSVTHPSNAASPTISRQELLRLKPAKIVTKAILDIGQDEADGFLCLCDDVTQQECLSRNLFARPSKDLEKMKRHIGNRTFLFLFNFQRQNLMGPFRLVGKPGLSLCPEAFEGRFGAHVRVKPMLGNFVLKSRTIDHLVHPGPQTADDMKVVWRTLSQSLGPSSTVFLGQETEHRDQRRLGRRGPRSRG